MTEREKQQQGLYYDTTDKELLELIGRCKDLCHKYNSLEPSQVDERQELVKKIIPDIGDNFEIVQPFRCDFGINIKIGKNFYSNYNLTILDCAEVNIGDNCFIGPNTGIYTPNHPLQPQERNKLIERAIPVTIGNNVWLGGNVVILPGVTIGDNCTIGAGAVVTKDIPANSVAVGNPAKVIKTI